MLLLIGGLIQINPIWQYGVYQPWLGTNGAQPDYYFGWLIGALRLMPNWELVIGGYTIIPNPFFGGILYPMIVFGILFAWPSLERRFSGDRAAHHLIQRPRDAPFRTGLGVALLLQVTMVQIAGSADRIYVDFGISYELQVWFWRIAAIVVPHRSGSSSRGRSAAACRGPTPTRCAAGPGPRSAGPPGAASRPPGRAAGRRAIARMSMQRWQLAEAPRGSTPRPRAGDLRPMGAAGPRRGSPRGRASRARRGPAAPAPSRSPPRRASARPDR